jgi:hypothetical protein
MPAVRSSSGGKFLVQDRAAPRGLHCFHWDKPYAAQTGMGMHFLRRACFRCGMGTPSIGMLGMGMLGMGMLGMGMLGMGMLGMGMLGMGMLGMGMLGIGMP